ncbi:hypothetical protein LEP1GSC193_1240 [Leptospira alstonii serovar Pingchang str. 80-412]|uniref:Uncharacterized protein n=2 Tax=Leptospira alstonii TaxID=28452 RepID=M6D2X2_9LEPT|nr:hypothetical protein LEP1GSC194_0906 [Leptospira alstonii serovar Sichuan str. 79601]EQA82532.1 hypothetical protein LEP1GSC193_1240 [Leptospira alstonii serovar Pingchang str. 80-412]
MDRKSGVRAIASRSLGKQEYFDFLLFQLDSRHEETNKIDSLLIRRIDA